MQKFFADKKTAKLFRQIAETMDEANRSRFHGFVAKAHDAKQMSEDDSLETYKLTEDDLKRVVVAFEATVIKNKSQKI